MNYDDARQLQNGSNAGKWHYTTHNKRLGTRPIGYCAENCPGHDTAEEAREHYRQYRLDKELLFHDDHENPRTLHKCEHAGCEEYTSGSATMGPYLFWYLCSEHRTRDAVEILFPEAGSSIHS